MILRKIYIIFDEKEIKYINKSCKNIFTFSPSILHKLSDSGLNLFNPNAKETALSSKKD